MKRGIGLGIYLVGIGVGVFLGGIVYQMSYGIINQTIIGTGNSTNGFTTCTTLATCSASSTEQLIFRNIPTFFSIAVMMIPVGAIYVATR